MCAVCFLVSVIVVFSQHYMIILSTKSSVMQIEQPWTLPWLVMKCNPAHKFSTGRSCRQYKGDCVCGAWRTQTNYQSINLWMPYIIPSGGKLVQICRYIWVRNLLFQNIAFSHNENLYLTIIYLRNFFLKKTIARQMPCLLLLSPWRNRLFFLIFLKHP